MGFSKKCTLWDPVFWPMTSKKLRGRISKFFFANFLRRIFWRRFRWYKNFWFLTTRGRDIAVFLILIGPDHFVLCHFFKKSKKSFKSSCFMAYFVSNFLLIISLKTILVYQVPPTQKIAKIPEKIDFQVLFSRNWDIFGTNGYVRWNRLKKFFKMGKNCFFSKVSPNGLNLAVSRSPNSRCLVKIEIFSKFLQKSMEWMLFCLEKNIE